MTSPNEPPLGKPYNPNYQPPQKDKILTKARVIWVILALILLAAVVGLLLYLNRGNYKPGPTYPPSSPTTGHYTTQSYSPSSG